MNTKPRYTESMLEEIAEFYKNNSLIKTSKTFGCSTDIVRKSARLFDVSKIPHCNRIKKRQKMKQKSESRKFVAPPMQVMWKPPSLAAGQHDSYVGKPI